MIIGITGVTEDLAGNRSIAGSGKDTVARRLVERHRFVSVALADPMKRFCKEVFDFSDEQMWGASEERNKYDDRYPRSVPGEYLTPRYALQQLGTAWGRDCYDDVWVFYCLRVAHALLANDPNFYATYCPSLGLDYTTIGAGGRRVKGVVIPDLRFHNEFERIKEAGGKVWRVRRQVEVIPKQLGAGHLSEKELLETPDSEFDASLPNNSSIQELHLVVDAIMHRYSGRVIPYDEEQEDTPPFMRAT